MSRQQDHAVEVDVCSFCSALREAGAAHRPVAFAEEVLGRIPAAVLRQELRDELGEGIDVLVDPVERLFLVLAGDPAEPGARRVDEHQVAGIEQALVVVDDLIRRGRGMRSSAVDDAPRAERAHVQPHRRRARPAVEEEGDRSARRRAPCLK